jgi:hypothetical protein
MSWKDTWPEREPRPKLARLTQAQKELFLNSLQEGIATSPVLSALALRVRSLRGRFYLDKPWYAPEEDAEMEMVARVSPRSRTKDHFLLDAQKTNGNWYEVMQGTIEEVLHALAYDTRGTFHGLGALEKSLRETDVPATRRDIDVHDNYRGVYRETGEECTVPEVLYHVYGVPIPVIAEPREWYAYHRTPKIVEVNDDRSQITVEFTKMDMYYGREHGDACVYAQRNGKWEILE